MKRLRGLCPSDELSAVANELVDVLEMYLQKISQEEEVC